MMLVEENKNIEQKIEFSQLLYMSWCITGGPNAVGPHQDAAKFKGAFHSSCMLFENFLSGL